MAHWGPVNRMQNLVNQLGGESRIRRIESGELVLVERSVLMAFSSSENGGISPYVSNLLNPEAFIADWREFYRQVHSIKTDPSSLMRRLPPVTPGFNWGVWVLEGTTSQRAYEMCQAMFPCSKWCGDKSLDEVIDLTKETRTAQKRQYVAWCRDRVEADDELENTTATQIVKRQINVLGLTEVELLCQWFFWKSGGKHLDVRNITRCDGSRYSGGSVPRVGWSGSSSELLVGRCALGLALGSLRSRQAVS